MPQVIEKITDFYREFSLGSLADLDKIYANDVVFEDPVHTVNGLDSLRAYFANSMEGLDQCGFEFTRHIEKQDSAFLEWKMHYSHPRLRRGQPLELKGSSVVEFGDTVTYQRDYYDLGEMLYEHVPFVRTCVGIIKNKLVSV